MGPCRPPEGGRETCYGPGVDAADIRAFVQRDWQLAITRRARGAGQGLAQRAGQAGDLEWCVCAVP